VMELVDGPTLADHLATKGRLEIDEAISIVLPIASALACAHRANIVHRDLKPSNILLAEERGEQVPKLADFGLARVLDEDEALTADAAIAGTVAYMAPEQLEKSRAAGPKADQYALAVVLYEALTGTRPFVGDGAIATMRAVARGAPSDARHASGAPARARQRRVTRDVEAA